MQDAISTLLAQETHKQGTIVQVCADAATAYGTAFSIYIANYENILLC